MKYEKIVQSLIIIISIFFLAYKENWIRVLGNYSHFSTFSEGLNHFNGIVDILENYQKNQFKLGIHNGHYPPGNLILLYLFPVQGVKIFLYLLIFPILIYLNQIRQKLGFTTSNLSVYLLVPSLLIFPSLDFVLLSTFFFVYSMYLIICKPKYYSILLGLILALWLFFNFNIFVGGLFLLIHLIINREIKNTIFRLLYTSLLIVISIYVILYLCFKFSIIHVFIQALHQNTVEINGNLFNSFSHYILTSTGNLLNFILGFGPMFFVLLFQAFINKVDFAKMLIYFLIFLSFSSLFYLETDRVWYMFAIIALIPIEEFFKKQKSHFKWFLIGISAIYVLLIEFGLAQ